MFVDVIWGTEDVHFYYIAIKSVCLSLDLSVYMCLDIHCTSSC